METASLQNFRDLDCLYLSLLAEVKSGGPIWEDIIGKGGKLFTALRATVHATNAFLDAIQRLADLASKTSGGSKEIGAHFTRLCMRQKRLGTKVKTMGSQLITCMVNPLAGRMDEWKKTLAQIEKEHNREAKRTRGELKRALSEANRLKRKLAKQGNVNTLHSRQSSGGSTIGQGVGLGEAPTSGRVLSSTVTSGIGTSSLAVRTESATKVLEEKIRQMEDLERATIRRLMLEERRRYCFFFNCLRPVLETETSLLGEISTLHELFTALSTATEDPSCLLEEAETVLAHAGAVGKAGVPVSPSRPLHPSGPNEVEAFASAVEAIMSSRQRQQQQAQVGEEATPSLASESLGSTSSGWSSSGGGRVGAKPIGLSGSPNSSQVSVHSSSVFGPQNQITAILRQSRPQNDIGPRSASVGRSTINGTPQRIVTSCDAEEVILRRPTTNGACTASTPVRQRPQTTTSSAKNAPSFYTSSAVTPAEPSPNHRNSTCTLQQLNDTLLPADGEANEMKVSEKTMVNENEEVDEEEETASGTLDDETSDDGVLSDEHRHSNGGGGNALSGSDELGRPALSSVLTHEHRSLSRGGDPQTMLYPDQSLPPPVYTNLNKLTYAARRKFYMSSTMSSNAPDVDADTMAWQPIDEGDNLSVASAPHVQPDQKVTNGSVYSVPGSPHRPSLSTSSSNSRPRGSSTGVEDPFSVEMDELDRMVTGSSATSSVTSRSGRSGTEPPSQPHSRPQASLNHSTGIPTGATPIDPLATQYLTALEKSASWALQPASTRHNTDLVTDVESQAAQISPTAASLLTQLSGQLQQLTSSSTVALLKHPSDTDVHTRKESGEFNLPAPPSPDLFHLAVLPIIIRHHLDYGLVCRLEDYVTLFPRG
ncbi:metastasis suppressor protein 1 [Echinococcus multilocularis]|uniref:Metastasis suppressor protein 1 n=1 Tax=Echinococcus multilocularis TaxID=6211 RepID=A0A068YB29_ECHMU|nr:metastasis suppressor protein 1 [Echinococcus multilocularis]